MDLQSQWRGMCRKLNVEEPDFVEAEYTRLARLYGERHRVYHTLAHIAFMLERRQSLPFTVREPEALLWAIWYHDAVYDPRAHDNEERSADLAVNSARAAGFSTVFADLAASLINQTKSHQAETEDGMVLIDLDLAILGADATAFDAYEAGIRKEYDWVPQAQFVSARLNILERFLACPNIYGTQIMQHHYEGQARANLARSIASLRATI